MSQTQIHPTALVDSKAELDPTVEVGPWCVIGPNVRIGRGTRLLSHVVVDGHTRIGEHNVIHSFSVIGGRPQDLKYKGEPTELVIGNQNTIRESVTINTGTVQAGGMTRLGNGNLLMAYVHLGHDCDVKDNTVLSNYVGLAGHVTVEDSAILTGMVGVAQFCRIGAHTYIGGQSGIEKDVPPYTMAFGSRPCSIRGVNIVGLRRRGFSAESISVINEAVKLWSRPDVQKEQCILDIEAQFGQHPEVQHFLAFIREAKSVIK